MHQIDSSSGGEEDLDEVARMMPREVSPRDRKPEKRGGAGKKAKKEGDPLRVGKKKQAKRSTKVGKGRVRKGSESDDDMVVAGGFGSSDEDRKKVGKKKS